MTATAARITKNTEVLTDREIVQLATEFFNDALARRSDPEASEDTKQVIDALWRALYEKFRPSFVEEVKPKIDALVENVKAKGSVTLNIKHVRVVEFEDGPNSRTYGPKDLEREGVPYDQIYRNEEFQHLPIAGLIDGEVIDVIASDVLVIRRERVVDTSRVTLPDNWTSDLAGALATAFAKMPAPQVAVENIVETPTVNVDVNLEPGAEEISFDRNHSGQIVGAKIKPA